MPTTDFSTIHVIALAPFVEERLRAHLDAVEERTGARPSVSDTINAVLATFLPASTARHGLPDKASAARPGTRESPLLSSSSLPFPAGDAAGGCAGRDPSQIAVSAPLTISPSGLLRYGLEELARIEFEPESESELPF